MTLENFYNKQDLIEAMVNLEVCHKKQIDDLKNEALISFELSIKNEIRIFFDLLENIIRCNSYKCINTCKKYTKLRNLVLSNYKALYEKLSESCIEPVFKIKKNEINLYFCLASKFKSINIKKYKKMNIFNTNFSNSYLAPEKIEDINRNIFLFFNMFHDIKYYSLINNIRSEYYFLKDYLEIIFLLDYMIINIILPHEKSNLSYNLDNLIRLLNSRYYILTYMKYPIKKKKKNDLCLLYLFYNDSNYINIFSKDVNSSLKNNIKKIGTPGFFGKIKIFFSKMLRVNHINYNILPFFNYFVKNHYVLSLVTKKNKLDTIIIDKIESIVEDIINNNSSYKLDKRKKIIIIAYILSSILDNSEYTSILEAELDKIEIKTGLSKI